MPRVDLEVGTQPGQASHQAIDDDRAERQRCQQRQLAHAQAAAFCAGRQPGERGDPVLARGQALQDREGDWSRCEDVGPDERGQRRPRQLLGAPPAGQVLVELALGAHSEADRGRHETRRQCGNVHERGNPSAHIARRAFVAVARDEFTNSGRKQSISRVALLTGLARREVAKIYNDTQPPPPESAERVNRSATIISGWTHDMRFRDRRGKPASLVFEHGSDASFGELVRIYGNDVPARAALDELMRVGVVTKLKGGRIKLLANSYIPDVVAETVTRLGSDAADLIGAIDNNLQRDGRPKFFQRKVAYDDIPTESLEALRAAAAGEARPLIERLDRRFAAADRDAGAKPQGAGRARAMVGVYYFEEIVDAESES